MTDAIVRSQAFSIFDRDNLSRRHSFRTVVSAMGCAAGIVAGAWLLDHPGFIRSEMKRSASASLPMPAATIKSLPVPALPVVAPSPAQLAEAADPYGRLLDPQFSLGSGAPSLAQSAPLGSSLVAAGSDDPATAVAEATQAEPTVPAAVVVAQADAEPAVVTEEAPEVVPLPPEAPVSPAVAQLAPDVPLPMPRPAGLDAAPAPRAPYRAAPRRLVASRAPAPVEVAAPDNRSFFEKVFGIKDQPAGPALAYAGPEDGGIRLAPPMTSGSMVASDAATAVYDISAHTVYLPDGSALEAHSGLGHRLDDPRFVHERNKGPTPPHLYQLSLRESLFHGVQALRLTPIGGGHVYGRDGLLAHTFMLGPNGDSNGCVSFRNYQAFLQAFRNGRVKRLVVVARR